MYNTWKNKKNQAREKKHINREPILVIGAGSWGTALALHLARAKQLVKLWSIESDHMEEMINEHVNRRYFPKHPFPSSLKPINNLNDAMENIHDIVIAVPSVGFRDTLNLLKPLMHSDIRIVWATKGVDLETGQLLHEVIKEILGENHSYAVLSGPSFASEVADGLPTAVMIASHHATFANDLVARFHHDLFRVELSADFVGVEVGSVIKNVFAIATGISDGLGFGTNARSAIITRGFAEMIALGMALGAKIETLTGLAGLGDLVLTCTDDQSRNRRFGLLLGKGLDVTTAEKEIGQVVEGKRNAELVMQLAERKKISVPITQMISEIIQGTLTASEAMRKLF